MKAALGLLFLAAITYGAPSGDDDGRILNGHLADDAKYPFMVSIQENKKAPDTPDKFCGGVVISPNFILTAAHCFDKYMDKKGAGVDLRINAGVTDALNYGSKSQFVKIAKFIPHPKYVRIGVHDDICLVKLETPLKINKVVRTIALPSAGHEPTGAGEIMGWGYVDEAETIKTQRLQFAPISVSDFKACEKLGDGNAKAAEYLVCVGANDFTNACRGDSGGPFVQQINGVPTVMGVTSFGDTRCRADAPAFYTKVSHYMDWIQSTLKEN